MSDRVYGNRWSSRRHNNSNQPDFLNEPHVSRRILVGAPINPFRSAPYFRSFPESDDFANPRFYHHSLAGHCAAESHTHPPYHRVLRSRGIRFTGNAWAKLLTFLRATTGRVCVQRVVRTFLDVTPDIRVIRVTNETKSYLSHVRWHTRIIILLKIVWFLTKNKIRNPTFGRLSQTHINTYNDQRSYY